jgi:lysophospholipase L1-like esterase
MKIKNILILFALGLLFACEPKIDTFTTTSGEADFSKYVSLGNSLTSGYADGDLYKSGQENSYPAILAGQFEAAGGGEFKQPLMFDEYGFGRRFLLDASIPGPVLAGVAPDERNFQSIAGDGPFNNMGVPGAKSFHLGIAGYGTLNPYFGRFASAATTSVLADAIAQNPTFFSLWIGNNDVLAYALTGASSDSITPMPYFAGSIGAMLQKLTENGAKGIIANIPNITSIPYFTFMNTRLPYNGLVLTEQAQVDALNAGYAPLNAFIKSIGSTDTLAFALGQNGFVIAENDVLWGMRQMKSGELFLLTLPTDSIKNYGYGSQTPIPDKYILSTGEINEIKTATTAFNTVIKNYAQQFDIAFVDMNAKLSEIEQGGVVYDGVPFTTAFITGNSFSLDGVHMTGKGNALAANYFIDAINAKYGSVIKHVSPRLYPGIYYYQ